MVEATAASTSLLIMPFHAAPKLENSTSLTSFAVRSPKARMAKAFWLSAGEPTTMAMRLPLRSFISFTPVSLATLSVMALHEDADSIRRSACGPHSLMANS